MRGTRGDDNEEGAATTTNDERHRRRTTTDDERRRNGGERGNDEDHPKKGPGDVDDVSWATGFFFFSFHFLFTNEFF
jgi:hypothetical protein